MYKPNDCSEPKTFMGVPINEAMQIVSKYRFEKMKTEDYLKFRQEERVTSDGWSTSYYDIPNHVRDVDDLIVYFNLPWRLANILKACVRYGRKDGTSKLYDLNKIRFFVEREIEHLTNEEK